MVDNVQNHKPTCSQEVQAWLDENLAEQEARYQLIVKEMEELEPQRKKWNQEFLEIVETRGFNVNGDIKRKIDKAEIPTEPKRKNKVVF